MLRLAPLCASALVLATACGGDDSQGPPVVIGDCGALAAPGVWEQITPPDVVGHAADRYAMRAPQA